jgi:hypothetical protein
MDDQKKNRSPLLPTLTVQQLTLIEAVASGFFLCGQWPDWEFVDETLENKGIDAIKVLASLPREHTHNYGYVAAVSMLPRSDTEIILTIAGLSQVEKGKGLVDYFLGFVSALGNARINMRPVPRRASPPSVSRTELLTKVFGFPNMTTEEFVLAAMIREPATWKCQLVPGSDDDWSIQLSPQVRRFAGVSTVEDYLARLRDLIQPVEPPAQETFVSPFTLPAAIDYLDVVWRLRFGKALVVPAGVERSARLAFDATTPEEADSRLSALAELLKNLQVDGTPGIGGGPLGRLVPFLTEKLPAESHQRITDAVATLDAARKLRVSGQHFSAQTDAVAAHRRLGLPYPVADWPGAWSQVQRAVTVAIDAIRDELFAADENSATPS